ncbi:aldose 1-epimerase [Nocardia halotolerans]|uniref:Aldose 1-epimerase n=1 Tax=Nocardia halotolerans TaxID=1755878 RepID=A0ABV8VJE9_9NOCA
MDDDLELTAADVTARISPCLGGRLTGLVIGGTELLRQGDRYGSFPMAPWCGRLRDGRFTVDTNVHQLALNAPPHAIHGTVRSGAWEVTQASRTRATLVRSLAGPWPFAGQVLQRFELSEHALTMEMEITSEADRFPAQAGWHPWFLRRPRPDIADVGVAFEPAWQEERGADHLPTGQRIPPRPGPWDDCFAMPGGVDVVLEWPPLLRLRIRSPERWVVLYDEQVEAVCVEPQSGPPNGLNTMPRFVTPADPLRTETVWTWEYCEEVS